MTQKKKRVVIDCTRGLSRKQRAINRSINRRDESPSTIATGLTTFRRKKNPKTSEEWWISRMKRDIKQWFAAAAEEEKRFGCHDLPDRAARVARVVPDTTPYEERPFGIPFIERINPKAKSIVSLALFDGDEILFTCSGIVLPRGRAGKYITRFLTSARLVKEFNDKRNKDDQMRVEVRLPNDRAIDGFLGLYDNDIAIVTSFNRYAGVCPLDIDRQIDLYRIRDIYALGRASNSRRLVDKSLVLPSPFPMSDGDKCRKILFPDFTEAVLGGPLFASNNDFIGVIYNHDDEKSETWTLPPTLLRQRLMHFGILKDSDEETDDAGSSSGGTKNSRRRYSLPSGVYSIVPSGFMRTINWVKLVGYPTPPPLMLELNGKLLNSFEDDFGEVSGWEGYEHNLAWRCAEYVWHDLPRNVFTNISRRAVSVVSFKGDNMFFACTGLLISWHERMCTRTRTNMGRRRRMRARTVILTSANLVRSRDDEDKIDGNLRIEVFLPPNQRAGGTLQLYHLNYNIAIISVKKHFLSARPENIFHAVQKPFKEVVAIGRDAGEGLLLATMGEVTDEPRDEPSELNCGDLQLSTCKIKKVGIGGPLINSNDGSFVGMNFYDDTDKTPFLPRSKIVEVLEGVFLPSQRASNFPVNMMDDSAVKKNRWPVPEAYWYHPMFDEDLDPYPITVGRVLQ